MGSCETFEKKIKKTDEQKEKDKQIIDEPLKYKIRNELYLGGTKRIPLKNIEEASKSICKISFLKVYGTCFFVWTSFFGDKLLITNYHVINRDVVNKNISITLEIYTKKIFTLNLGSYQNNILFFENPDITVIQINSLEELCKNVAFLEIDMNYINGYTNYLNKDVFTLGYPFGKDLDFSPGTITNISENLFFHNCDTDQGYSGSPIILRTDQRVIGIHRGGLVEKNANIGTFLGTIFEKKNNYKIINYNDNDNFNNKKIKMNNILNPNNKKDIMTSKLANGVKKINNINGNYIVAEYYIDESNINKDLRIINSFESVERERYEATEMIKDQFLMAYLGLEKHKDKFNENEIKFDENKKNENDIKNCQILIEGKEIPFSYYYKFKKIGTYKIIFSFHSKLKSLCNMFFSCESLTNIDLSNFNNENIITMSFMFFSCKYLRNINLSNFNTEKVINMKGMFEECDSLNKIDLSNFNTENVIDMSELFCGCKSLTYLDLSNFNTKNVENMREMFYECNSLISINISSFNTQKVTNMESMFSKCKSLIKLDLSNFNTKNVINMKNMFNDCDSLKYLDLNNFITQNVTNIKGMFHGTKIKISDIICHDKKLLENYVKES